VRLRAMWPGMWLRLGWSSHSGSRRVGCGHAAVWPPVQPTGQGSKSAPLPKCSTEGLGEGRGGAVRRRRRCAPRRLGRLVSKVPTVLPRADGLGGRQVGLGASRAVVAGVVCGGGAVTALESPARAGRGGVRGTACAGCARAPGYLRWGAGLEQRRGDVVVYGGARLGAMGGSEGGVRGRLTSVRVRVVRGGQVRASAAAKGSGVPLPPTRQHTGPSATTRPRRREPA
jgi:hypothetical protein